MIMTPLGRVVITGGAGFLGSHLDDYLLSDGYDVIVLDNLLTGSRRNIAHLDSHPRFRLIEADVTLPIEVDGPVDYVLHLASPASPKDYAKHPIHTLKVGALGTYHALGLAKAKHAIFLLASTSEIYGNPSVNPQPEEYWGNVNPVGERSVYDEAKRFGEAITSAYGREHNMDVRIARIFNTYGPRMSRNDGRVLPNFMVQALTGRPLTVYGDGSQTRSFCYVDDMVDGLYRLMTRNRSKSGDDGPYIKPRARIINLGNPEEVSVLDLAKETIEVTGSNSSITFCSLPEDDPERRRPDIARARRVLEWEPRVARREGLRRAADYFRSLLEMGDANWL